MAGCGPPSTFSPKSDALVRSCASSCSARRSRAGPSTRLVSAPRSSRARSDLVIGRLASRKINASIRSSVVGSSQERDGDRRLLGRPARQEITCVVEHNRPAAREAPPPESGGDLPSPETATL